VNSGTVDKNSSPLGDELIRDKAIRLFTFLRELSKLKTKVTRDLDNYESVVWFNDVPEYKGCFSILAQELDHTQSSWLEIRNTNEPSMPHMPASCEKWLDEDSNDDPSGEPFLRDEIPIEKSTAQNTIQDEESINKSSSQEIERITDYPEILQQWQYYIENEWRPWSQKHALWKAANDIYFSLFSIHQQLRKLAERYELLVGLGLLTWETPNNQVIRRHIIVGDAYLTFDANKAKFELQAAPEGVKLHFETEMIEQRYLPSLDQQEKFETMLSLVQESPWNKDELDKVLRSFIHSISSQGVYSDSLSPPDKPSKVPTVAFAPAIILRQRTQRSQIQFLSNTIGQISKGGDIPSGIGGLCEESEQVGGSDEKNETTSTQFTDETLYLPLPTNEEQEQIMYQIRDRHGILVQGPPGTGKSHTIANVLCHLLAQGKRVLVTSQTPRALKVLKAKIPVEMAALCVTLLGNDQHARRELDDSVSGINQKHSDWNAGQNQRLITNLEEHLYELRKDKANKERLLREQREIDTYHHEVAGGNYKGTAQQIAKRVATEESKFAWLEDTIDNEKPCPLSDDEFRELLRLYRDLSEDYCLELNLKLVSYESLPDLALFIRTIDDEKKAKKDLAECESRCSSPRYRMLQQLSENDAASLRQSISDLIAVIGSIERRFTWIQHAIRDVLAGNDIPWKRIHVFMVGHLSGLEEKSTVAQTIDVQFPEYVDRKKLRADVLDVLNHYDAFRGVEVEGKIKWGLFAPRVVRQNRYIKKEVRVNGQPCASLKQLRLLATYLEVLDEIELLWSVLQGKDVREEGSLLLQVGYLQERLEALEEVLGIEKYLCLAKECLKATAGVSEPQWHKVEELEEVIADIRAVECGYALNRVASVFENAIQDVCIAQSSPHSHILNQEILTALEGRDSQALALCLDSLESLWKGRAALGRREALHKQLNEGAPKLASQLKDTFMDNIWDERASAFKAAWIWKLADNWLRNFGKEYDEVRLETDLKQLLEEERRTISELAAAKAWDNCLRKLTESQRANLTAWATAMRRMPKTLTAKTRPKWLRQAQECMDNCRGAIPAWIMPLYRVFETIPAAPECFDVVIIDEASQTGPEGLALQYLGKQCIIVGDSQQIAPDPIGTPEEEIDTLVKRHLEGIPFKGFYHPATSMFAFAEILFSRKIVLREHFRCMPEIIQFSNDLCYKATPLKPLRQYSSNRLEPLLVRHVKTGYREGSAAYAQNRPEADALIETVVEMCSSEKYAGKTIGVISLQGESQAKYIEKNLLTRLSPTDLEGRNIVCGDAYAFQGDERDIILLSMVAALGPDKRIGVLNKEADKRRFNVAASRAKDQVVLFHTATINELHPECMRHKLLEYYLNPLSRGTVKGVDLDILRELTRTSDRRQGTQPKPFESWFEVDVCLDIADHGFRVIPQYQVAEYRIDLVIEGTGSQLAVECDGDEYHGIEQYESDVARQRILERCGRRFWRIRGHEYYRNPADSLEALWKVLEEMGIKPIAERESKNQDISKDEAGMTGPSTTEKHDKSSLESSESSGTEANTYRRKKTVEVIPKGITEKDGQSEICDHTPEFFFSLAHWSKKNNKLAPWERALIFNVGRYLTQGWPLSEKMECQSVRIIGEAKELGFVEVPQGKLFGTDLDANSEAEEDDGTVKELPHDFLRRVMKLREQQLSLEEIGEKFGLSAQEVGKEMDRRQQETSDALAPVIKELEYTPQHRPEKNDSDEPTSIDSDDRQDSEVDHINSSSELLMSVLGQVLSMLGDQESEILKLRHGLVDGRNHTLAEIGRKYGVTRERIRQIESHALNRLKHNNYTKRVRKLTGIQDLTAYQLLNKLSPIRRQQEQ